MRMEDVNARKAYIQKVRQSFDSPGRKYEFESGAEHKGEESNEVFFFKVRLVIAVCLFAAYVFCDRTGTLVYRYSAGEVAEAIARDYDYTEAKEEVLQVFRSLN